MNSEPVSTYGWLGTPGSPAKRGRSSSVENVARVLAEPSPQASPVAKKRKVTVGPVVRGVAALNQRVSGVASGVIELLARHAALGRHEIAKLTLSDLSPQETQAILQERILPEDLERCRNYVNVHRESWAQHSMQVIRGMRGNRSVLPRSILHMPLLQGQAKAFVLLKTKDASGIGKSASLIGQGGFKRVSYAYCLEDGRLYAFASAGQNTRGEHEITAEEISANVQLKKRPDLFLTGHVVSYKSKAGHEKRGMIMPFLTGGELERRLYGKESRKSVYGTTEQLPMDVLYRIAIRVAQALAVLHDEYGLVHRDMKPSNIILDGEGVPRIADFSLTNPITAIKQKAQGTKGYIAPEMKNKEYPVTAMVDVWAFGAVLADMIGVHDMMRQFIGQDKLDEAEFERRIEWLKSYPATGDSWTNIIYDCCRYNPHNRPTMAEVQQRLQALAERLWPAFEPTIFSLMTVQELVLMPAKTQSIAQSEASDVLTLSDVQPGVSIDPRIVDVNEGSDISDLFEL